MTYSERLYTAQAAALERAYLASLEPSDYYYSDCPEEDEPEEDAP